MAQGQKQSSVLARIAAQEQGVWNSVKDKEIETTTFVDLPPGINNGIALLKGIQFGTFQTGKNKDKPYFSAFGIVVLPKEHNGLPVEGLRTRLSPEPLCDTPDAKGEKARKTKADHWAHVKDQLKLLNGNQPLPDKLIDLEAYCDKLVKSKIYFRFRTWVGDKQELQNIRGQIFVVNTKRNIRIAGPFPNEQAAKAVYQYVGNEPMVNHTWAGVIPNFGVEEDDSHIEDNSATPTANGRSSRTGPIQRVKMDDSADSQTPLDEPVDDLDTPANGEAEPFNELADTIDDLITAAPNDEGARATLEKYALAAGYTPEEVNDATEWAQVGEMIRNPKADNGKVSEGDTTEPVVDDVVVPEKGQKVKYEVPNKDPRKVKTVTCDIVNVDTDKMTVDLKDPSTKAQYKAVKWEHLIMEVT